MDTAIYENPLLTRYASYEMQNIFSSDTKNKLWRKCWIALAKAEKKLGLPITEKQISLLESFKDNLNYADMQAFEREVRHDVMAHIKAYGKQVPDAAGILHLGATSCFVTDNTEIMVIDTALKVVLRKLVNVLDKLKGFALKYKALPTLAFTHLQPAQLTTVGKRATLWMQELLLDYENLQHLIGTVRLRGVKGTTGTQASYLQLFNGNHQKVKELETLVAKELGYSKVYAVTGQTYSRKFDYNVLTVLSQIAQSCYRFSNDMRILQSMKELEEPFEKNQIGSSAMAYKRNPMRSERMGALARYMLSLPINTAITASTQWCERTLDDSANKRIVIAQSFLTVDSILNLYLNIAENIVVYPKVIEKHIAAELPFMATENILMEAVKAGGDRQELHEIIRICSMQAAKTVKEEGKENNLIELLKAEKAFTNIADKFNSLLEAKNFIGRCPEQVEEFIAQEVAPILKQHANCLGENGNVSI